MKLSHIVGVSLLVLTLTLSLPCPAMAASANFLLTPATVTTDPGQSFDLNLNVNSDIKLDALELNLKYDPKLLELTSFTPTKTFNAEVRKVIDNSAGTLLWTTTDIAKPRKTITGNIDLGKLTFKAKAAGGTLISFSSAQVGSIDTNTITSDKNQVQVSIGGAALPDVAKEPVKELNFFQRILEFFRNLFKR